MSGSRPSVRADERFLICAPTGRDAALAASVLQRAGFGTRICRDVDELFAEASQGAAAFVLTEELLVPEAARRFADFLSAEEPWSDVPLLLFTSSDATIQRRAPTVELLLPLGNVILLDRPVRPITLVAAARSALRSRRRQYSARAAMIAQKEGLRRRDEFLAMLGHELRNPLGVILFSVDALEHAEAESAPRQREMIRRQTKHLARLVDDLLDVSRLTTGKIALQRRVLELGALVERSVQAAASLARDRDVEIVLRLASVPIEVDGDPVRLEQVVGNLLTNALKYSVRGGRATVTVGARERRAVIAVRDEGIGISPEMIPRIFDIFVQADASIDRSLGGLGIGLTIVRSLVAMHGGFVSASSAGIGRGAELLVELPLASGPVETEPSVPPLRPDGPRRVLVVEDSPDTRAVLKELLESDGHLVDVAADGIEGVERALSGRPEVAFVDIGLPGLDGHGVARKVRAALGRSVYLVAMTGYGQPDDRRRALDAGFDVFETKPIDAPRLFELLAGSPSSAPRA